MAIFNQVPPSGGGGGTLHTVTVEQGGSGCGLYVPTTTPFGKSISGYSTSFVQEGTSAQYASGDLVLVFCTGDWMPTSNPHSSSSDAYTYGTLGKYSGMTLRAFVMPDNDVYLSFYED